MNYPKNRLLVVVALSMTVVGVSSLVEYRMKAQTTMEWITLGWNEKSMPDSYTAQVKDGKIVAMNAVKKDGARTALRQQSKSTCATSCPAGQQLSCWEDQEQMMSMCACFGGGTGRINAVMDRVIDAHAR
ncbi:MAG: hypothetical protein WAM70_21950 [Pyrinomonadaceae bacterium]